MNATALRTCRLLLVFFVLATLTGCIRERESGDELVVGFRWWALLWPFVVAPVYAGLAFARHPSVWINGKWQHWWKLRGWASKEIGSALGVLAAIPICMFYQFDRVIVTPDYFAESNLLGFETTRQMFYRDMVRIEVQPPEKVDNPNIPKFLRRRKAKAPAELLVVLNNGRSEEFSGFLIKAADTSIVARARAAGVTIVESKPNNEIRPAQAAQPPAAAPQPKNEAINSEPPKFEPPRAQGSSKARDAIERAKKQLKGLKSGNN